MSFLTSFEKDAELVVSKVSGFFETVASNKNWQVKFTASVQALAGTLEGVIEITGKEADAAKIQAAVGVVNKDFASLTGLAASYNTAAPKTFQAQVQATLTVISTNLSTILSLIDVKNTTTVNEVTGVTAVVSAGLEALMALVPVAA